MYPHSGSDRALFAPIWEEQEEAHKDPQTRSHSLRVFVLASEALDRVV